MERSDSLKLTLVAMELRRNMVSRYRASGDSEECTRRNVFRSTGRILASAFASLPEREHRVSGESQGLAGI